MIFYSRMTGSVTDASHALQAGNQSHPGGVAKKSGGVIGYQQSLRQYTIGGANEAASPTKKKIKSRKGSTLHLYDPADVAEHTPCTIIHNFLPADDANALLKELLGEAETFERITFKLFDNVVSSPHTSSFFVESYDKMMEQKSEYYYNGAQLTVSYQDTAQASLLTV